MSKVKPKMLVPFDAAKFLGVRLTAHPVEHA